MPVISTIFQQESECVCFSLIMEIMDCVCGYISIHGLVMILNTFRQFWMAVWLGQLVVILFIFVSFHCVYTTDDICQNTWYNYDLMFYLNWC